MPLFQIKYYFHIIYHNTLSSSLPFYNHVQFYAYFQLFSNNDFFETIIRFFFIFLLIHFHYLNSYFLRVIKHSKFQ